MKENNSLYGEQEPKQMGDYRSDFHRHGALLPLTDSTYNYRCLALLKNQALTICVGHGG